MGAVRTAPIVMLAAAVAGLVESADLTLLPLFGLHAGIGERAALLLVTVFMAGNVILQTPIGLLADRFGRRFLLGMLRVVERGRTVAAAGVHSYAGVAGTTAVRLGWHPVCVLQPRRRA